VSERRPDEYPDGSVGHYVRERRAAEARKQEEGGSPAAEHSGARRDEAWGVVPDDGSWGSDLLELDGDLAEELDAQHANGWPSEPTPPHGTRYADSGTGWPTAEQRAAQDRAAHEQAAHEQAAHEQAAQQQAAQERAAQAAQEQTAREHAAQQRAAQEQAAREQAEREFAAQQAARDQQAREQAARQQAAQHAAHQAAQQAERERAEREFADQRRVEQQRLAEEPRTPPAERPGPDLHGPAPEGPRPERTVVELGGAHRPENRTPPSGLHTGPMRDVGRWTDPSAVAAQEAQRARTGEQDPEVDLSSAYLLRPNRRRTPSRGWRRWLYLLSAHLINPGEGPEEIRERELTTRINQPLLGCHKIATLSLKGGVGKTTITATLGATFASLRGDRVVAVDANPDRGTLSQKIPLETSATVRHLLRDSQRVRRYTDVRAYTSQGPSRLEVLASEQDPAVSEAFSEDDYRRTVTLLEHFYNIVLTDCGTGLMHSAMYGVLGVADQLIIVSSGSIDGARSASATMDWLEAHDHGDLVRNAVAVINNVHRQAGAVDLERVAQHFAGRCRAVIQIPFDPHLEEGAEVDLDRLGPATRMALLDLAASVADGFPS
jgi:MinD-like ATPase involved in chromosome partitioning or flagellar assembly